MSQLRTRDPRQFQYGFSLVELMVAITLALFVLAGMGLTLANTSNSRADLERALRQIENGRYAMQLLSQDLHHAGYYGRYVSELPVPAALPDLCAVDLASLAAGMALPIQGYEAPTLVPAELAGCLDKRNFVPGTDILVIRRAQAAASISAAAAETGQVYLQTSVFPGGPRYVLGNGSDTSVFTLQEKKADHSGAVVAAGLLPYHVHVYFVSPCDVPASGNTCDGVNDDDGRPAPTLKRLELASDGLGAPVMRLVPLVEGIQNLQLDYGMDNPGPGTSTGDGSPDTYVTTASLAEWSNVVAVRVNLLAMNTEATRGHTDTKSYNLGLAGSVGPFNDNVKRHAYSAVVRVNNVSGQREE
jgi:type IV pilus assembly protein PilW